MDRAAWQATVHGVTRVRHDLATKPPQTPLTPIFLPREPMDRRAQWATVHGVAKSWT